MTAYHLRKTEIEYELKIRGQPTEGTAGELRKRYSQCLANNIQVEDDAVLKLDPDTELEQSEEKLEDLTLLVTDYEGDGKDNEYLRISARLWHLYLRVSRIPVKVDTDEEVKKNKKTLEQKTKALLDFFEAGGASNTSKEENEGTPTVEDTEKPDKGEERKHGPTGNSQVQPNPGNTSTNKEANDILRPPSKKDTILPNLNTSNFNKNIQLSNTVEDSLGQLRQHSIPVYKWGIRFDGHPDSSIGSFLERVEELRRARGVRPKELFESAVDLFSGPALVWYRSTLSRITSWEELCHEMKIVFQSPDYDFRLRQEIFNRLQGEQEQIDLYIAAMEGLYARLSEAVPEASKLSQIYNNLHPYLQDRLALFEIKSLEELRFMGRRAEAGRLRANIPRNQTRTSNTMEPEFAYVDPYKKRSPTIGKVASLKTTISTINTSTAQCWNCNMVGHKHRSCQKERKKFCWGCGAPDTIKPTCSHCKPKNVPSAGTS